MTTEVWEQARSLLARRLDEPCFFVEEELGRVFQRGLSMDERRARGTHFTPRELASRVVARVLQNEGGSRPMPRVLDPAMGAGVFLCEALRQIHSRSGQPDTKAARLATARACAFGVDRDLRAVALARAAVWLWIGDAALAPDALAHQLIAGDALFDALPLPEFDVVVGNPPFLGGKRIRTVHGEIYAEALKERYAPASGNTDLAAHFLRRSFEVLAPTGVLGLVVTNTIAQGATRRGGLEVVLARGGELFSVERRVRWPGEAGVVVSLIFVRRGPAGGAVELDGREVSRIDSHFSSFGQERPPQRLSSMQRRAFVGCFLRGKGFIFDDDNPDATPLEVAASILREQPDAKRVIRPLLGGAEVLTHPRSEPHRQVIHFDDSFTHDDAARRYPKLLEILRHKVRPVREALGSSQADRAHKRRWWRFANTRPELFARLRGLEHVVVVPRMSARLVAVRLRADFVPSDQLVVVASGAFAVLALLSSRLHEMWARRFSSTLGDGLRYTPQSAFETFPLPCESFEQLEGDATLNQLGAAFDEARRVAQRELNLGLTTLLSELEREPGRSGSLARLRLAQDAVDAGVLAAYGLSPTLDGTFEQLLSAACATPEREQLPDAAAISPALLHPGPTKRNRRKPT